MPIKGRKRNPRKKKLSKTRLNVTLKITDTIIQKASDESSFLISNFTLF